VNNCKKKFGQYEKVPSIYTVSLLHRKLKFVSHEKIIIFEFISLIIKKFSFLEVMGFKKSTMSCTSLMQVGFVGKI
jgi:hypothetical protein